MGTKHTVSYDTQTGEILDGAFVYVPKKARVGDWFMGFQKAMSDMAQDPDFTGATYRIFHLMLSQLDFENYIIVNQSEMARKLDMKTPNVSREIAKLCKKGVLMKGPKSGHQVTYRLNPNYAWRGKAQKIKRAQREFEVIEGGRSDYKQIDDLFHHEPE